MELRMHNSLHGYKRAHKQNPRQLFGTKLVHLCRLTRIAENTEESKYWSQRNTQSGSQITVT
jgi:hypothetical protein